MFHLFLFVKFVHDYLLCSRQCFHADALRLSYFLISHGINYLNLLSKDAEREGKESGMRQINVADPSEGFPAVQRYLRKE